MTLLACKEKDPKNIDFINNSKKPNIIIILTDDQGYSDVGFNGSKDILTPHLDEIAKKGVIFSNGYVTHPYCSPSRAGLMTGRYQQRFGHEYNVPFTPQDSTMGTPKNKIFLSNVLKDAGYKTCAIGKWHLGDHPNFLPPQRGFDHWFGFSGGSMNYWGYPYEKNKTMHVQRNGKNINHNDLNYLTDDFTNEALSFIEQNHDNPFFMYLSYNAPHSPDHTTKQYLKKSEHIENGIRSVYAAMIAGVDEGVGKINSLLTNLGLRENTLIIFLSDNGGRLDAANNGQFRGHKGMLFEGGIRVPFTMSWPAKLPKNITYTQPISSLDIFSTSLAAADIKVNKNLQLDGKNLIPFLKNKVKTPPHEILFWRVANGEEYAVRKGNFKLIKSAYKKNTMLFDLSNDEMETKDISLENPKIYKELKSFYNKWDKDLALPKWTDPHLQNVKKEEQNVQNIRYNSLSKKERENFNL
jgi:arylsulfatase A-like enzyme